MKKLSPPCATEVRHRPPQGRRLRLLAGAALLLAAAFALLGPAGPAVAQEGAGGEPGPVLELTLAEAVRLAFEYDVEHEIARLNWENARIDNMIARAGGPVSPYEELQRQLQERRAENNYLSSRKSLVMSVVQEYFDLQQAATQAEVARRQAAIAERELEVVRQMVAIGERHPQDELREQNRVASARMSAEAAERTYRNREQALRQRLGLPDGVRLVLVDEPEAVPFDWTLEETLAYALEHNFSVWERATNLRIAQMDLEALKVQDPAPLQLQKAENSWRVTELNALQAERNFYNQVTSAWHSLMDAARRLESAAIDYELAQSAFAVARRQHEMGLTTDIEWERAQLDHINAQQSYRDAVVSYVRTRLDLLNLIGHPFELDEEFAGR